MSRHPAGPAALLHSAKADTCVSSAFSSFLAANAALAAALASETSGKVDRHAAQLMLRRADESLKMIGEAKKHLECCLEVGRHGGSPYLRELEELHPLQTSARWATSPLPGQSHHTAEVGTTLMQDPFAPTRQFIEELELIETSTKTIVYRFGRLQEVILRKQLREHLKDDLNFPEEFASLMTKWTNFSQRFLAHSLLMIGVIRKHDARIEKEAREHEASLKKAS